MTKILLQQSEFCLSGHATQKLITALFNLRVTTGATVVVAGGAMVPVNIEKS